MTMANGTSVTVEAINRNSARLAEKSLQTLQSILAKADPEKWFDAAPKISSPWDQFLLLDLRGVDLSNQQIGEVLLAECDLEKSNFTGSVFEKTHLQSASVSGAKFLQAKFYRTQMIPFYGIEADFSEAEFKEAAMTNSKLFQSNFSSAFFYDSSIDHVDFSRSHFSGAHLEMCRCGASIMKEVDLVGAKFVKSDLNRTIFQGAQLTRTVFDACDLRGADFRGANLTGTVIRGGAFGIVSMGSNLSPTRFDDTPEVRRLVAESGAEGVETIEWHPIGSSTGARPEGVFAGQPCPRSGYWFTPATSGSRRYFKERTVMPKFESDYGDTIWQWSDDQSDPKLV